VGDHLFVYGSLLPGLAPPELREVLHRLRPVCRGALRGTLYDLGEYPGAVPDATAGTWITGRVFELPGDPALLARLDAYEGHAAGRPGEDLFTRVRRPIALSLGGELDCWVYAYARDPGGAERVACGDWLAHLGARAARAD
jgi:gamma-glutamylcyclotransferase (GGCT)/AIG2-like uncharacterized protein YtfP